MATENWGKFIKNRNKGRFFGTIKKGLMKMKSASEHAAEKKTGEWMKGYAAYCQRLLKNIVSIWIKYTIP